MINNCSQGIFVKKYRTKNPSSVAYIDLIRVCANGAVGLSISHPYSQIGSISVYKQKRLDWLVEAFNYFCRNDGLDFFLFCYFFGLFVLPHGEFTGSGESSLNSEAR